MLEKENGRYHIGGELLNSGVFRRKSRQYHAAHFNDSNRGYMCDCSRDIFIRGKRVGVHGKRYKTGFYQARNEKIYRSSWNLWKATHKKVLTEDD